jgi:hypothetical protein
LADVMAEARRQPMAQVTDALSQTMKNWLESWKGYMDTARAAFGKGIFTGKEIRHIDQMTSLHRTMTDALEGIKTRRGGALGMVNNLWRFSVASTDFAHRALLTGVESGGRTMEDFLTRQQSMKTLMRKAGLKNSVEEFGAIISQARKAGDAVAQDRIEALGDNPSKSDLALARNTGRDAALKYMREAVGALIHPDDEAAAKTEADEIRQFGEQERRLELGLQGQERGAGWDVFNYMAQFATGAAQLSRQINPLLGRLTTGFVSVPTRLLDRSLSFTPVGLARALTKHAELKRGENKLYLETIGSTAQLHQRMVEGIVGTAALGVLIPLVYGQEKQDDPNYTGFRVTLAGPKDKNLRDAWKKQGHRPGSIEWVQNGKVRGAVNYARGGPESAKTALIALGTLDDMRLNGTLQNPDVVNNVGEYMKEGLSGGLKEAAFFGLKNLAEIPAMSGESEKAFAGNLAYMTSGAIPWSGFVRSVAKLATGPIDQSSTRAALVAQTPFLSFAGQPALNFLGDPIGEAPSDPFTTASDRLAYAGLPLYLGISAESANAGLYDLMMRQGHTPSAPSRSALERKNGFLTDSMWQRYVKTRGQMIKSAMQSDLGELERMEPKDFAKAVSHIDADAQRETKERLNLK